MLRARGRTRRAFRWLAMLLLMTAGGLGLQLTYLLWFTGFETARAQDELAAAWEAMAARPGLVLPPVLGPAVTEKPEEIVDEPVEVAADAFAALWFQRDGKRFLTDVLYVVKGVTPAVLRRGPGHYPDSVVPGAAGNLAIAGHRTTYGSPFHDIDELRRGDTIHVMDRDGIEWVYRYRDQQVVTPSTWWPVRDDPLQDGSSTITLTTCHPRNSDRQRLVVFGEFLGAADEIAATLLASFEQRGDVSRLE